MLTTYSLFFTSVAPGVPTVTSSKTIFGDGDEAILTCTLAGTGFPEPTIQWVKSGTDVPSETGTTLTFAAVTFSDDGDYTCRATNDFGMATSPARTLTVTA